MRKRTVQIVAKAAGMQMPIATVVVQNFASQRSARTINVCPKCGKKPKHRSSSYRCPKCKITYPNYNALRRTYEDGVIVKKPRLAPEKGPTEARLFIMDRAEFSQYTDALDDEFGITPNDANSYDNLRKLAIAVEELDKVIIIRLNDTYEQRITLLSVTMSGRVVFREIIPMNLVKISETMRIDRKITPTEIKEVKAFITQLPKATEKTMMVTDFRVKGFLHEKQKEPKPLAEIVKEAKRRKRHKEKADKKKKMIVPPPRL